MPSSRAPSGFGICSVWLFPTSPWSSPWHPLTSLCSQLPSMGWPLSMCLGGRGGGAGPHQGSWDGGGALGFLLFIALGLWGGFPWPPPPPQGRGRSLGESQAWGGSPGVRRGGRSFVSKVPGLHASSGPGPRAGLWDPLPPTKHHHSQDTSPCFPALVVLTGAYLGAGASWGHREWGGLVLGVL